MLEFKNQLYFQQMSLDIKSTSFKYAMDFEDQEICYINFCNGIGFLQDQLKKYDYKQQKSPCQQLKSNLSDALKFYQQQATQFQNQLNSDKQNLEEPDIESLSLKKKDLKIMKHSKTSYKLKLDLKQNQTDNFELQERRKQAFCSQKKIIGRCCVKSDIISSRKSSKLIEDIFGNVDNNPTPLKQKNCLDQQSTCDGSNIHSNLLQNPCEVLTDPKKIVVDENSSAAFGKEYVSKEPNYFYRKNNLNIFKTCFYYKNAITICNIEELDKLKEFDFKKSFHKANSEIFLIR